MKSQVTKSQMSKMPITKGLKQLNAALITKTYVIYHMLVLWAFSRLKSTEKPQNLTKRVFEGPNWYLLERL